MTVPEIDQYCDELRDLMKRYRKRIDIRATIATKWTEKGCTNVYAATVTIGSLSDVRNPDQPMVLNLLPRFGTTTAV